MATVILLAALVAAQNAGEGGAGAGWAKVADGVEQRSLPEAGGAELLRFDLRSHTVDVMVPGAQAPRTAADARSEQRALLAVNGGFFDTDGRPLGLRIGGGKQVKGLRPRVDWGVLLCRRGSATIVHSRDYRSDPAVEAALQVGPRILVAGVVPPLKPQSSRRTAVAVDAGGRTLTVLVTRQRISASALGEALLRLGFSDALLLDGGPSTQLSAMVGSTPLEIAGVYPVPDLLLIRRVSSPQTPAKN